MVAAERKRKKKPKQTKKNKVKAIGFQNRSSGRTEPGLTALLLVTHVPTVVVAVALPYAADTLSVGTPILIRQTSVF